MYEATFEGSELPDDPRPPHDLISPSAGEEGMGDLGRKPGRSNDTSTFFFFFKPLLNTDISA